MKSLLDKTQKIQAANTDLQQQIEENNIKLAAYQILMFTDLLQQASQVTDSLQLSLALQPSLRGEQDRYSVYRIFPPQGLENGVELPDVFQKDHLDSLASFFSANFFFRLSKDTVYRASFGTALTLLHDLDYLQKTNTNRDATYTITINTSPEAIDWVETQLCHYLRIDENTLEKMKIEREQEHLSQALPDATIPTTKKPTL